MNRNALLKVGATSLILAVSMVGCTGAAYRTSPSLAGAKAKQKADFAALAESALAKKEYSMALTHAEAAVEAQPDSGAYRTLLGRAYLANGRFSSAQTAFRDAMTLGNVDSRTVVSLALIDVAQGDAEGARKLLIDQMDRVPAADYGLAMAMAGDPGEGVRVLGEAIHDPSADAKTRQNLAYAYALAGRWREARLIAEQDVDPLVAAKRVLAWAEMAQPGLEAQRVAALMGVVPQADAGMPVRLALAPVAPAAPVIQTAEAAPAPLPAMVQDIPAVAAVEEAAPVKVANAKPAMIQQIPVAPSMTPFSQPIAAPRLTVAIPPAAKPSFRKAAYIKPVTGNSASPWVVQLGAFDSAAVAADKWQHMSKFNAALGAFPVVNSTATVDGRLFYRLAVGGFGDRAAADRLCQTVRARGGNCFVRAGEGVAPKADRWAAAKGKPKQVAALPANLRGKQFASR
ncbi:SPOR domain-containing protein [Sphingobium phenoxybenzoativorans]|uniref:SPOR domain-containing protein n=1 Tax=Sphingobium phenoxybenzoativorans TaxID=1592790 RepID=UPI000B1EFE91|nr:SPOR domain-containing protein [Sphingobium phenoxybenzoativorans]